MIKLVDIEKDAWFKCSDWRSPQNRYNSITISKAERLGRSEQNFVESFKISTKPMKESLEMFKKREFVFPAIPISEIINKIGRNESFYVSKIDIIDNNCEIHGKVDLHFTGKKDGDRAVCEIIQIERHPELTQKTELSSQHALNIVLKYHSLNEDEFWKNKVIVKSAHSIHISRKDETEKSHEQIQVQDFFITDQELSTWNKNVYEALNREKEIRNGNKIKSERYNIILGKFEFVTEDLFNNMSKL